MDAGERKPNGTSSVSLAHSFKMSGRAFETRFQQRAAEVIGRTRWAPNKYAPEPLLRAASFQHIAINVASALSTLDHHNRDGLHRNTAKFATCTHQPSRPNEDLRLPLH
ncbi:hypothetical protein [Caballeronia sp. M1242]|uniref:hypothetical protein n=1 Tax=Caballeronia sp. M1242 TaxID=2814653 RepID=UPI0019CFDCFC|nr:hypothetical protein [Caballeronia sp. M1242]QSN64403.1 hypothetical protein JYK05_20225 [Caballeronia sp. M1242]